MKNINVVTINKEHARILKERGIQAAPIYNSMEDNYEKNRTEKKKRVVWVNNIKPRKRPEYFMDLASRFSASNYEFLMVGNIQSASVYHQKLIEECCERNKNFKYLGGKTPQQVDEILAGASIFVNTCAPEGFGNNFIQAWLNECPTVTFEFDPDGIIEREKIGFCSDGNFEKMADNLRFLMDDEEQRHNMGKRARVYALANHSLANNAARYEEFFKRILRKQ